MVLQEQEVCTVETYILCSKKVSYQVNGTNVQNGKQEPVLLDQTGLNLMLNN